MLSLLIFNLKSKLMSLVANNIIMLFMKTKAKILSSRLAMINTVSKYFFSYLDFFLFEGKKYFLVLCLLL